MEEKEEKSYMFVRRIVGTEWGVVTASSEEEARQRIMDNDVDDVIENSVEFTGKEEDILELKED